MAQVPIVAVSAPIRTHRSVLVTAVALHVLGLTTADVERLRGAAAVDQWEIAVDELSVGDGGHAEIVGDGCDSTLSRFEAR